MSKARTIKFRAWDSEYKVMDNGPFWVSANGLVHEPCARTYDTPNTEIEESRSLTHLMQYVGLKDKNGVEIYFDDVVVVYGYGNLHVKEMCDLVELYDSAAENDIGEILGNIHANPELLEAEL